jgi:hypothetical protein
MRKCSIIKHLEMTEGGRQDYEQLSMYHYRDTNLGPYAAIYILKPTGRLAVTLNKKAVGVIVYTMPSTSLELRSIALSDILYGLDKKTRLSVINKTIRTISRVIVEPRFRNLGLATTLVRETLSLLNVPIIEAMAVMGLVNPFFEKAGMTAYKAPLPARCVQMKEAFEYVGVKEDLLIDAVKVQKKIERLGRKETLFLERQMREFLASYGKARLMPEGLERTRYILSKLTARPVYYIWFNPSNSKH